MSKDRVADRCPMCGGSKKAGTTTYTADLGFGVVVVRNVPATVCQQYGEEWIDAETAKRIEGLVEEARRKRLQAEVLAL